MKLLNPLKIRRILGIDPGSRITGWGIVEIEGNQLTHIANGSLYIKSKEFPPRLKEIYEGLSKVIKEYNPSEASIEQVFVSKNPQSALKLGHARGAAIIAALNAKIEIHEYTPTEIKQAVTGSGRAAKEQVGLMVQTLLALSTPAQTDAADALAAAICHILKPSELTALIPRTTRRSWRSRR